MSIYQPNHLSFDGEEIDMSLNQVFTCIVHGNQVTKYQLIIRNLDNTILYDTTMKTLATKIYEGDALDITLPMNCVKIYGNIKYTITIWNSDDSATSREVGFFNYANPVLELPVPSVIENKSYTFQAIYNQTQGIPISDYLFTLYDNNLNVIETSDKIYNTKLQYTFDGFISGNTYSVECKIINRNGYITSSGVINFEVNYDIFGVTTQVSTTILQDKSAIAVNFGQVKQIIGNYTGNMTYVPNYLIEGNYGLKLADVNTSVTFKLDIPAYFQYYKFWNPIGFTKGTIVSFDNGAYTLEYDSKRFIMTNAGAKVIGLPITLNGIYLIAIRSLEICIFQNNVLLQSLNYN